MEKIVLPEIENLHKLDIYVDHNGYKAAKKAFEDLKELEGTSFASNLSLDLQSLRDNNERIDSSL